MAIKEALQDELENSESMLEGYEKDLSELPIGSLQRLRRGRKYYYYIVSREDKKINLDYVGKESEVSENLIREWANIKKRRGQYRNSISKLKKQIRFLKGVLRGKEPI